MLISWRVVTLVPETACVYNWKGPAHLVTLSPLGSALLPQRGKATKPYHHELMNLVLFVRHPSKRVFYLRPFEGFGSSMINPGSRMEVAGFFFLFVFKC